MARHPQGVNSVGRQGSSQRSIRRQLITPGSEARRSLAESIEYAKRGDRGRAGAPYMRGRALHEIPSGNEIVASVERRLKKPGTIYILDKGAGEGHVSAHLKKISLERIHTTAMNLPGSKYHPSASPFIDEKIADVGILVKHGRKYDIIIDAYGEDYFLPKELVEHSINKTIGLLKGGGEAFVTIPLNYRRNKEILTVAEGRALARKLKAREGIATNAVEVVKKTPDRIEYIDLTLHIRKAGVPSKGRHVPRKPIEPFRAVTLGEKWERQNFYDECREHSRRGGLKNWLGSKYENIMAIFWEFRASQGWKMAGRKEGIPEGYWRRIRKFSPAMLPPEGRKIIEVLSSKSAITAIQAGSTAKPKSPINDETAGKLATEARAVFTWYFMGLFQKQ